MHHDQPKAAMTFPSCQVECSSLNRDLVWQIICGLSLEPPDSQTNIQSVSAVWMMKADSLASGTEFYSNWNLSPLVYFYVFFPHFIRLSLHDIQHFSLT